MSTAISEAHREFFSSYRERRWHPSVPLAVVHQWYQAGDDTGFYRHEDFYALYIVRSGRGVHIIDDHPYPVVRGDVYLTPPGVTHCYRDYLDLRAEAFCFQIDLFPPLELDALRSLAGFWDLFIATEQRAAGTPRDYQMHLSPAQYHDVELMLDEIFAEMAQATLVAPILVRGLLFRLLVYLSRAQAERDARSPAHVPGPNTARGPSMTDIVRLCEERFAEDISVPQLAALMFLSPSHFSELFAREVGMPPAAYLRRVRLEHAQRLLRTTALPINAIAQQTGLGDASQLARAFRAAFGMKPTGYRQMFKPGAGGNGGVGG